MSSPPWGPWTLKAVVRFSARMAFSYESAGGVCTSYRCIPTPATAPTLATEVSW